MEPVKSLNEIYCQRITNKLALDEPVNNDEMILLAEFIINVIKMRQHQKDYFKHRKQSDLITAKGLEKYVDMYIQHINEDEGTAAERQMDLRFSQPERCEECNAVLPQHHESCSTVERVS